MRFKSFPIGRFKVKHNQTSQAGEALTHQIAGLEEQVNHKTRELEAAKQQIRELSSTAEAPDEDNSTKPHGPLGELTLETGEESGDDLVLQKIDLGPAPAPAEENVKMAEVKAAAPAPPAAPPVAEAKPEPAKEEDDSLLNLFSQDEAEVNPLDSLIKSLPDVTVQELLDDLQEIKEIMKETKQG